MLKQILEPGVISPKPEETQLQNTVEDPAIYDKPVEEVKLSEPEIIAPPKIPENLVEPLGPDLVVEENGKFSVQSSSEEKIEDKEQPAEMTTVAETTEEPTTQNETEITSRSTSSMGQSSWSVTQSNTDDYKVSLFF